MRESKNPKHKDKERGKQKMKKVWGLTLCSNKKCESTHNRDKNAGLNMYKITEAIYKKLGRPEKYKRTSLPLNDGK
jgi:ribosomal protein L20A (L18A)